MLALPPVAEIRAIAYGGLALGLIALGCYVTHQLDESKLAEVKVDFSNYRAQASADNAASQKALGDALRQQLDLNKIIEANNDQLRTSLQQVQADAIAAHSDADFARRLLAAATQDARATAGGPGVPKAQGGRGSDGGAPAPGGRPSTDLLGDVAAAAAEARECFEKYTALQLQLSPQL